MRAVVFSEWQTFPILEAGELSGRAVVTPHG